MLNALAELDANLADGIADYEKLKQDKRLQDDIDRIHAYYTTPNKPKPSPSPSPSPRQVVEERPKETSDSRSGSRKISPAKPLFPEYVPESLRAPHVAYKPPGAEAVRGTGPHILPSRDDPNSSSGLKAHERSIESFLQQEEKPLGPIDTRKPYQAYQGYQPKAAELPAAIPSSKQPYQYTANTITAKYTAPTTFTAAPKYTSALPTKYTPTTTFTTAKGQSAAGDVLSSKFGTSSKSAQYTTAYRYKGQP